ncbi:MAG: FHA domain-containing protein, partial [Verrucomicrobiota bacterium]|nr:FHA domain-containing protein [Verrucomicrobiota bacterium]
MITHILVGPRITLGRKPNNTIQIADTSVSAQHAEFINVDGHYRLRDLESMNFTRVNGEPITDYHLAEACKLQFGSVECEFSLETPQTGEIVPTRDELEFLRRENVDLQLKLAALQKQIGILSSARLMLNETTEIGLTPNALRKLTRECSLLREENVTLKLEMENLRVDISNLTRDRNATRQGWETVKAELERRQQKTALRDGAWPRSPASPRANAVPPVST